MKTYTSFIEIEKDLKKLELKREIAKEELKIVKHNYENILEPINWINSVFRTVSKYGVMFLIKRMLK